MSLRLPICEIVKNYKNLPSKNGIDPRLYSVTIDRHLCQNGAPGGGFGQEVAQYMQTPGRDKTIADGVAYMVNYRAGLSQTANTDGQLESTRAFLTSLAARIAPDIQPIDLTSQIAHMEEEIGSVIKQMGMSESARTTRW